METSSTSERLLKVLANESVKLNKKKSKLKESFNKLSKLGIANKSTYTLPLKDTIGKTFREQSLVKSL